MSVLRTVVLIVILVIGTAGLVSAARLLPRLLAHARVTRPAARRPPDRHETGAVSPTPDRRDPTSGPPP
jgi:hypothetical protein